MCCWKRARFDARTGAFVDVFARGDGQPGGLNGPNSLAFGPDGALYVSTEGSVAGTFPGLPSEVLRFDVATGAHSVFIGTQPSNNFTGGLSFDRRGRMFVAGFDRVTEGNPGALMRFDALRNRPLPAHGLPGALFVAPTPSLERPIGVLVVE
jgi:hypothetical protein